MNYTLLKITLKDGKPSYNNKTVILPPIQQTILCGKGERGCIYIHKEHLKLEKNEDTDNNQQDASRSVPVERRP